MKIFKLYSIFIGFTLLSLFILSVEVNAATDKTKPIFSGVKNTSVYLHQTFNPKKGVTAKDNVDGNITSLIKVTGNVNTKKLGKYTLNYSVTDSSKNTQTVKRVITVIRDKVKPNIIGASNKTVYFGYSFNPKTGVSAKDNADGNITSKIKVSGKVNTKKLGKYKITYTVTDKNKNTRKITRTIKVIKDTTKPKFSGTSNKVVYMGYSFNPKSGVSATDNADGNITNKIKISGKVNTNEVGIYKLTYTVEDKSKNKATVYRTITVKKDTTKPIIKGAINTNVNLGSVFSPKSGVSATDNLDGNITNNIKITGSVNTYKAGTYELTYTVKDKTGNTTTVTRIIEVVDQIPPTITGIGLKDGSIRIGSYFNPLSGIQAYDQVSSTYKIDLTSKIKVDGQVNVNKAGTYTIEYSVTDQSGLTTKVKRKITVIDEDAPIINGLEPVYLQYFDTFDPMEGVTAFDNSDGDITRKIKVEGNIDTSKIGANGTYIFTYTVSDESGHTTTKTRNVYLSPRTAEFVGVEDITINLGETIDPLKGVKAYDSVTGKDVTSNLTVQYNVDSNVVGNGTIKYYFLDGTPYSGSYIRTVKVKDNIPPVIEGIYDITINQGYDLPDLLKDIRVYDNVDGNLKNYLEIDISKVNTNKAGNYKITYKVTDKAGNTTIEHRNVTVKFVPLESIQIYIDGKTTYENTFKTGQNIKLFASFQPNTASNQEVVWTSSNNSIATVDKNGNVTTLKEGNVTFTATGENGVSNSVDIIISDKPLMNFDSFGYGIADTDFDLYNHDHITININAVQVFNNKGELVQSYSNEDLKNLGLKTKLLPEEYFNMKINFPIANYDDDSIVNGGRLVVLASPANGKSYEFTIHFTWK